MQNNNQYFGGSPMMQNGGSQMQGTPQMMMVMGPNGQPMMVQTGVPMMAPMMQNGGSQIQGTLQPQMMMMMPNGSMVPMMMQNNQFPQQYPTVPVQKGQPLQQQQTFVQQQNNNNQQQQTFVQQNNNQPTASSSTTVLVEQQKQPDLEKLAHQDTTILGGATYHASTVVLGGATTQDAILLQMKKAIEKYRQPLEGSPEEQAQAQEGFSRLSKFQQKQMVAIFSNAKLVEERIRNWTGNKDFLVTVNAKYILCQPCSEIIAQVVDAEPSQTEAKLLKDPDYRSVSHRHLAFLANGKFPALQKQIWGALLNIIEELTEDREDRKKLNSALTHFRIAWDLPNSPIKSRFIHDDTTLIYVINAHCVESYKPLHGDVAAVIRMLHKNANPSQTPIEVSGDLQYVGNVHHPCVALDFQPDELSILAQNLGPAPKPQPALQAAHQQPPQLTEPVPQLTEPVPAPLLNEQNPPPMVYKQPVPPPPTSSSSDDDKKTTTDNAGVVPSSSGRAAQNQYGGVRIMFTLPRKGDSPLLKKVEQKSNK